MKTGGHGWLAFILLAGVLLLSVVRADVTGQAVTAPARDATAATHAGIGGDFTLTDHLGRRFELGQQRGKVVVMFFGFTHCPVVCPDTLGKMAYVLRELEQRADQVTTLFVTVDPERDTGEKLAQYLPFFSPRLLGLTGTVADIARVAEQYRVRFSRHPISATADNYTMDHTADIYVLNRDGQLDSIIPYGLPAAHVLRVVEQVLAKGNGGAAPVLPLTVAEPDAEAKPVAVLTDLQGRPQRLEQWRGKPLLINVWATWCPSCRRELPALNRAWQQLGEAVPMLALNVGEKGTAVSAFLEDYPIAFPVWLDEAGTSLKQWGIRGMPTTLLLDADGQEIWRLAGERAWDEAEMLEKIRRATENRY
ncbi:MAG TPA: SCO family protein [Thiolinea sp.]|nr:SCO family protein [Thiolinea sp.]